LIRLQDIKKVYMIGIGGIGMSAIARYFHSKGIQVSGYDKTATALTETLTDNGIDVVYEDRAELAPADPDLVVFTPAVPSSHPQLTFYRQGPVPVLKRSEVLGIISHGSFNICIAGTHGKTTISTMVAHILKHSGYGANAFLGGISVNYDTNFISDEKNVSVIEADEYDRSFLRLSPDIAIISSMDPDHLDIYGTEKALGDAFVEFSSKVKTDGLLITRFGLKRNKDFKATRHLSYSLQNDSADIYGSNIRMKQGSYAFDVMMPGNMLDNVTLNMGGMHNVENAVAAIAVASHLEIDNGKIKAAVSSFKGVKRRFEYILNTDRFVYIDDYAHHPEELRALISSAKSLFKGSRCTVIFQPHLFSRTKDLAKGFAESLDLADAVILLPIYPARELPVEGVTSELITEQMDSENKVIVNKEALIGHLKKAFLPSIDNEFGEVLITAGAGDIDTMINPIKELVESFYRSRNTTVGNEYEDT
jgi:UDP-N-acetylmuramate--alanine ligase